MAQGWGQRRFVAYLTHSPAVRQALEHLKLPVERPSSAPRVLPSHPAYTRLRGRPLLHAGQVQQEHDLVVQLAQHAHRLHTRTTSRSLRASSGCGVSRSRGNWTRHQLDAPERL